MSYLVAIRVQPGVVYWFHTATSLRFGHRTSGRERATAEAKCRVIKGVQAVAIAVRWIRHD
jgi:hypothetical protein